MPTPGPAASHGTDDSLVPPQVDQAQEAASTSEPSLSFTLVHLRQSWKWASISQFLYQFEPILGLAVLNLDAIEHDLTSSSTIHIIPVIRGLLHTLTQDRKITEENWETYFRKQYRRRAPAQNPFGIVDGFEDDQPIHWTELDGPTKLNALHALVEWHWASPNRIRGLMGALEESAEWRFEPIGSDSKRNSYWVMGGTRLWIQHPRPGAFRPPKPLVKKEPKARKGKGKRAAAQPASEANGTVWRKGRPPGSLKNGRAPPAARGTRSRPPPPSDSEPPAKKPRLTRTSRNSRRHGDDDEWQSIPDEWLADGGEEDATPKATRRTTRNKKPVKESVSSEAEAGPSALFDDDSDLTSISDSEPAGSDEEADRKASIKEDEEFDDAPYVEDGIELSTAEDPGFLEWETVCATQQEWEEFGKRFATSRHKGEKALHRVLNDTVIPGVITALQELEVKLRPPPPPEPEPEVYGGRKRSSRLAIKEIQAEEARTQERKKVEQDELDQRLRNGDKDARLDDNDRTKRTAAREARRKAQTLVTEQDEIAALTNEPRKKMTTKSTLVDADDGMEVDYDGDGPGDDDSQSEYQDSVAADDPDDDDDGDDFEPDTPPKSRARGGGGRRTRATFVVNPKPVVRNKDDWLLDCDICGKKGWNVDDGSLLACCEKCTRWQHVECHNAVDRSQGRALRNWDDAEFICGQCQRRAQQRQMQSTMPGLNPHHLSYGQVASHSDPRAAYFAKAPPSMNSTHGYNLYPNAAYYSGVAASMAASGHPVPGVGGNMNPHPLGMGHPLAGAAPHLSMQQPPPLQSAYAQQHAQHYQPRPTPHPNLKDMSRQDMYAAALNGVRAPYHATQQNPYPQLGGYSPQSGINNIALANNHGPLPNHNHNHGAPGAAIRTPLPPSLSPAHQQQPPSLGSALPQSLTPTAQQQRPITPGHPVPAAQQLQQQQQQFAAHQQRPLTPAQQQQMMQLLYANQQRGLPTPPPTGLPQMNNVSGVATNGMVTGNAMNGMSGMNGMNGMNGHWASANGHLPAQAHHQAYPSNGPLPSQGYPGVHTPTSGASRYPQSDHLHAPPPVPVVPPTPGQYYTPTNR